MLILRFKLFCFRQLLKTSLRSTAAAAVGLRYVPDRVLECFCSVWLCVALLSVFRSQRLWRWWR